LKNQEITFAFYDTDSSKSVESIFSSTSLLSSELIIYVVEANNAEARREFTEKWLPAIRKTKKMLYVIQSKLDQVQSVESFDVPEVDQYERYQGFFDYSAKTRENIEVLLFSLSNIFFFSSDYLYNFVEERLTSQCLMALRRIFWLIDSDNTGLVEKTKVKNLLVITEDDVVKIDDEGTLDLDGFLQLMISLILTRNEHLVWNLVQKFNYNEKLQLEIDDIM